MFVRDNREGNSQENKMLFGYMVKYFGFVLASQHCEKNGALIILKYQWMTEHQVVAVSQISRASDMILKQKHHLE